jgi:hypothetical protein
LNGGCGSGRDPWRCRETKGFQGKVQCHGHQQLERVLQSLSMMGRDGTCILRKVDYDSPTQHEMAMIKCRASSFETSLAEKISVMSITELMNATQAKAKESGRTAHGTGGELFTAICASFQPIIGYIKEAAKFHR